MATTIREQIVAHVLTTLESITTANGYEIQLLAVERLRFQGVQSAQFPVAMVVPMNESVIGETTSTYVMSLSLAVFVFLRAANTDDPDDLDKQMNHALGAVVKAMEADPTRGGKASTTQFRGDRSFGPADLMPFGDMKVEFDIQYRQSRTNPYATV